MSANWSVTYKRSFSRNIGILTEQEQDRLLKSTVAVAGLGGIGGATFLALVRMGVGRFHITDIDEFGIENLNRQMGSDHSSLGRPKIEVMAEEARKINPEVEIVLWPEGVNKDNVSEFLKGVDAVADCIDYFCLTPRELLLSQAEKDQIPICFVAPLAFSATLLAFEKGSMSYKEYFAIDDTMDSFEKLLRISIAIAPKGLHQKYMNFTKEQLVEMQTGPSIAASIYLGGGLLAAEILFSLTNRRKLFSAPFYSQFDLLRGRYARGKLLWGNKGPIQRIKIWKARKDYISEKEAFLSFIK